MLPDFAFCYIRNRRPGHAKFLSQVTTPFTSLYSLANGDNLILSKFDIYAGAPSLLYHVLRVVLRCAKKKMIRVNATVIVALMKYPKAIWYWAVVHFPGKAMGKFRVSINTKLTIASSCRIAKPQPALISGARICSLPETGAIGMSSEVARKIRVIFTDYVSSFRVRAGYDISFLTAAALAIAVWDFLRGIIGVHQNLQFWCQSRGRHQRRSAISIGVLPVHCSTSESIMRTIVNRFGLLAGL